ncbi:transposase [Clostridium sp. JN-9]|jgi:hypothetical protein|uniref:transposase n=1 Tax=Clostridium sp. JN-9 TaxID=2507159 RepID=UPI000FFE256F|nr:transposase [Clostridium sp. JN-9]QAT38821.1 transposase [Clostridium sp. JN-9]QAT38830.1 transposase [Clostridium sp. JN-9]QAT39205.1 transposase [Clostridium sp. JN-9]QAT39561.1 transposase [Clostridium sp. JN-9]QAT39816.1 transposase [Clostridium sp. JN-9]
MGREQDRINRRIEKNPAAECNKIQKKYFPELFQKFAGTLDPRHQSYIDYSNKVMLGTVYYKGIAGLVSMQSMTYEFNDDKVVKNIMNFLGESDRSYLPHGVTVNEYLEKLATSQLQEIQQSMVYSLIRRKTFDDARYQKKWLLIVDGSQLYSGSRQINEQCLERHHNKGTVDEKVSYHSDVLEAKIVLGEKLIVSIASEFVENNGEDALRQKSMSEEERKQDCETKAFQRLAAKLKKRFPRLPIILLADSLYASEKVMEICRKNHWDFIIRYKTGSIPSIAAEYEAIPEKGTSGHAEYVNEIDYKEKPVNMLRYWEEKVIKGKNVWTEFQWLTSLRITDKNAENLAAAGRKRWKIENEGFNRQKNWQGNITHVCSWNVQAMKNHYLMLQISDTIKQLYEWYYLKANDIKKKQKNISSDLLASFGQQLTREDIFQVDMHSISTA